MAGEMHFTHRGKDLRAWQWDNTVPAEWPAWVRLLPWQHAPEATLLFGHGDTAQRLYVDWFLVQNIKTGTYAVVTPEVFKKKYFPEGDKPIEGLPVAGYRPQNELSVALVNANKRMEEATLRALDALAEDPNVDKRWLAIGRTHLETGWMCINRAIFKPERVKDIA